MFTSYIASVNLSSRGDEAKYARKKGKRVATLRPACGSPFSARCRGPGASGCKVAQLERHLEQLAPQSETAARVDDGAIDLPACAYVTLPLPLEPDIPVPTYFDASKQGQVPEPGFTPRVAPGSTG